MAICIPVNLPDRSYNILIEKGSLANLGAEMSRLSLGKKVLLVSNPEIFEYYGQIAVNSLEKAGFTVSTHLIPAGENYKTLDSIAEVYDSALAHRLERSSTMVALGGGVIGDMTGFAAATWLRGVNFVQVPTTLLAMVDASIGGKTGVNHPQGKNLIGAFYQPKLVLIDLEVLKSLPVREFRAGMAEVIKYGVIWDAELFKQLEDSDNLASFSQIDGELLQTIITKSCQAKADVVSKDEKEAGLRAILNYGHTIAHGIESLTGYTKINHGEAVAMGMVAAGAIAVKLGMWTEAENQRQTALIAKAGLETQIPPLNPDQMIEMLTADKKVKDGKVRFILPTAIGQVTISDRVTPSMVREVLTPTESGQ
ncbi:MULTISPECIES: 3-dehydroquinate synthase [unclassified Microcystis]|uniref:3-dehydroquinate synthase n=1 Tax=unclassified Microcystis TaxID=2643300 RepID=UPI001196BEAC|nr:MULTISPECIES: 3-dehydroquinate synthase [unclassified Microcystis]MCA2810925.1 3-dehydroquinate synthase [Microcystis sp. M095S1]MCA2859411.1 3-dehydroquinate synthase [Microcystis sp. M005S1]MCA2868305.1 3-dehydroquinate synthase [Microcystis sp. M058S1]MCA2872203.1 3-dehydroquinate synthase [Microcystis sp. M055S1]MCA2912832.1 3-dehydroquinate synthase [Microcystis sp. M022S1]